MWERQNFIFKVIRALPRQVELTGKGKISSFNLSGRFHVKRDHVGKTKFYFLIDQGASTSRGIMKERQNFIF